MDIFRDTAASLQPANPSWFTGPVQMKLLAGSEEAPPAQLYRVAFEPGGCTNWHTHSGSQWLFVVEGRIRVQVAGDAAIDLDAGDAVVFPPGEKHWHGAAPGSSGVHLAINIDAQTTWMEPVGDYYGES